MQSLPARRLEPRLEAARLQHVVHAARRFHHALPRHVRRGVEIEHDAIRLVDVILARAPGVQLEHAVLHERDEATDIAHEHVVTRFVVVLFDVDGAKARRDRMRPVLLVEALPTLPLRTAHERQRPSHHMGQHQRRHRLVVAREIGLRDAGVRKDDAFRMRERDACDFHQSSRRTSRADLSVRSPLNTG